MNSLKILVSTTCIISCSSIVTNRLVDKASDDWLPEKRKEVDVMGQAEKRSEKEIFITVPWRKECQGKHARRQSFIP